MVNLLDLENQGWNTLTSGKKKAQNFYNNVLRNDAVMVFPGGIRISGKEQILESFSSQPWESFQIMEPNVLSIDESVKTITYKVKAKRPYSDLYHAIISSTYVKIEDTWKLVHHQHS